MPVQPFAGAAVAALALMLAVSSVAAASCDESISAVFRRVSPSVPRITALAIDPFSVLSRIKIRVGSGIVIDDASNIVTNAHVVVGAKKIIIAIGDDLTEDAEVVGIDPISDLAVVRTADRSIRLPKAVLGSSHSLEIGEDLLAIGYPFGLGLTATRGIVSGAERVLPLFSLSWMTPLIQTDAALNPGNSGGPVVNLCGEVVGVSTLSATKAQNLNFAIPIDAVRELVPQLLEQGHIVRAWHGINGKMVPPILQYGLGMEPGFLVETIEPGSPAERIGLRGGTLPVMIVSQEYVLGGDIITAVNGESLSTIDDVVKIARSLKVGDRLTLTYWRDGEEETATVTLPERPILPEDLERFQRD